MTELQSQYNELIKQIKVGEGVGKEEFVNLEKANISLTLDNEKLKLQVDTLKKENQRAGAGCA